MDDDTTRTSTELIAVDDAASTLPTIEQASIQVARSAKFVTAYARAGHADQPLVIVTVEDDRGYQLARSTYATNIDPRRVCEHVLAHSRLERCSQYRPHPAYRETRVQALISARPSVKLSAYERLRQQGRAVA
ncbi:hypothetical protein [Arenivirga flava]|nr:hypothetical protein [Arenivirga flava]